MADLVNQEILSMFLKHLPVKTLMRFRRVSKYWKEVIDSRSFILDHVALQRPRLILQNRELEYVALDPHALPIIFDELSGPDGPQTEENRSRIKYHLSVVSSVDGIICFYDNANRLLLWNPSIRRLLRLPLPQISPHITDLYRRRLCGYFKCCGFWMDPSNNHFKVAILFLIGRIIMLFCSRKQAWMEVDFDSDRIRHDWWEWTRDPQNLVEGVGHWKVVDHENGDVVIVSFDFGRDKFGGTIELPQHEQASEFVYYSHVFVKWRDCVAVLALCWDDDVPRGCDLWALQNGSWTKMFSFNLVKQCLSCQVLYMTEDYGRVLAKTVEGHCWIVDPY